MIPSSSVHIDDSRLAAIADGSVATGQEEIHLAQCRTCAALHAELIRLRVAGLVGDAEKAPAEVLTAGHRFVDDQGAAQPATNRRPGISPWRRGALRIGPALAAVAVLLILVGRGMSPGVELPAAVRLALIDDSTMGVRLVHPLIADERAVEGVANRGRVQVAPSSLAELQLRTNEDPESVEATAAYVAGLQAFHQQRRAREVLDDALFDHPDDEILRSLEIYQLALEGKDAELEARLRARVERLPNDRLARLNLAIVLGWRETPDAWEESVSLATGLADSQDESVLGVRARRIFTPNSAQQDPAS